MHAFFVHGRSFIPSEGKESKKWAADLVFIGPVLGSRMLINGSGLPQNARFEQFAFSG